MKSNDTVEEQGPKWRVRKNGEQPYLLRLIRKKGDLEEKGRVINKKKDQR